MNPKVSSEVLTARGTATAGVAEAAPAPRQTAGAGPAATPQLTQRDLKILQLIFEGKSNKVIAAELGFTHGTIRVYVSQILRQLGATSRTGAIFKALAQGILEPRGHGESSAGEPGVF